jgi:hypothetical protein
MHFHLFSMPTDFVSLLQLCAKYTLKLLQKAIDDDQAERGRQQDKKNEIK